LPSWWGFGSCQNSTSLGEHDPRLQDGNGTGSSHDPTLGKQPQILIFIVLVSIMSRPRPSLLKLQHRVQCFTLLCQSESTHGGHTLLGFISFPKCSAHHHHHHQKSVVLKVLTITLIILQSKAGNGHRYRLHLFGA